MMVPIIPKSNRLVIKKNFIPVRATVWVRIWSASRSIWKMTKWKSLFIVFFCVKSTYINVPNRVREVPYDLQRSLGLFIYLCGTQKDSTGPNDKEQQWVPEINDVYRVWKFPANERCTTWKEGSVNCTYTVMFNTCKQIKYKLLKHDKMMTAETFSSTCSKISHTSPKWFRMDLQNSCCPIWKLCAMNHFMSEKISEKKPCLMTSGMWSSSIRLFAESVRRFPYLSWWWRSPRNSKHR